MEKTWTLHCQFFPPEIPTNIQSLLTGCQRRGRRRPGYNTVGITDPKKGQVEKQKDILLIAPTFNPFIFHLTSRQEYSPSSKELPGFQQDLTARSIRPFSAPTNFFLNATKAFFLPCSKSSIILSPYVFPSASEFQLVS